MNNDNNGLRDAVRSFALHFQGDAINEICKKEKFEEGGRINDVRAETEGRIVKSKEELIEVMVDRLFEDGLADALKKFHEEHGFYPPLPDPSKGLRAWFGSPPEADSQS